MYTDYINKMFKKTNWLCRLLDVGPSNVTTFQTGPRGKGRHHWQYELNYKTSGIPSGIIPTNKWLHYYRVDQLSKCVAIFKLNIRGKFYSQIYLKLICQVDNTYIGNLYGYANISLTNISLTM